ncbi:MAG: hypothetical protein K0R28_3725 [Paenibacillus sp.]|jgi:hypothetical protein|nr:hypothetical protein [Paenibacillus sp.]
MLERILGLLTGSQNKKFGLGSMGLFNGKQNKKFGPEKLITKVIATLVKKRR